MNTNVHKRDTLIICFLFLVLVLLKYAINISTIIGPIIYDDELLYKSMAENLFNVEPIVTTHSPPLYPVALVPAFFFKSEWYSCMLLINAIISSALIIPLWFIAKDLLPRRLAYASILIACLWPFHWAYSRVLMSENLFLPLFLVSILILIKTEQKEVEKQIGLHALLGCCMALAYLTRYLYLIAIPVIVFIWLILPLFHTELRWRFIFNRWRVRQFFAIILGFTITYLPWLIYTHVSGFSTAQAMGFEFISSVKGFSTLESLGLWTVIYWAYFNIFLGPCLFFFILSLFLLLITKMQPNRNEAVFMILTVLLSLLFLAVSIQHSWRASYNYPFPNRIMGRYLIQLWPLYLLTFFVVLHRIISEIHRFRWPVVIFSAGISIFLQGLGRKVLFDQPTWPWKFGFINSPEVASYQFEPFWIAMILGTCVMAVLFSMVRCQRIGVERWLLGFVLVFLTAVQSTESYAAYKWSLIRNDECTHGRVLSRILRDDLRNPEKKVVVLYQIPGASKYFGFTLNSSIKFWLSLPLEGGMLSVVPLERYHAGKREETRVFILTDKKHRSRLLEYGVVSRADSLGVLNRWIQRRYHGKLKKVKHYYLYDEQTIDRSYFTERKPLLDGR